VETTEDLIVGNTDPGFIRKFIITIQVIAGHIERERERLAICRVNEGF
jgi:hypothetical protein